ncbi:hypothetical protein [Sphingomonas sp.]|nr:hypothetical protein [Sphingomonas sp.]
METVTDDVRLFARRRTFDDLISTISRVGGIAAFFVALATVVYLVL